MQYATISADGAFAPQTMIAQLKDMQSEDTGRGHSRVLLGGVYPEGEDSTDIIVTENNHGLPTPLPNLVSRRRLAQAGYDVGPLSEPGEIVCGDGVCGDDENVYICSQDCCPSGHCGDGKCQGWLGEFACLKTFDDQSHCQDYSCKSAR